MNTDADLFAAEVIRNDDRGFPFAHGHDRIVPLARAYVAMRARIVTDGGHTADSEIVGTTIALLNSMIQSGELHTYKSADQIRAGFDALARLETAASRAEQVDEWEAYSNLINRATIEDLRLRLTEAEAQRVAALRECVDARTHWNFAAEREWRTKQRVIEVERALEGLIAMCERIIPSDTQLYSQLNQARAVQAGPADNQGGTDAKDN